MMTQPRYTMLAAMMLAAEAYAQDNTDAPEPRRRIVASIPDRKLALIEDDQVIKVYDIAVGAPKSPSPSGAFEIANRIEHPTWWGPRETVAPGKANPLGTRWMGLSKKGYGIHGTNNPRSIGRNASHGCIRMRNAEVEELFARVKVGDEVRLIGERTEETAVLFGSAEPAAAVAAE
ncbi:MAG: L,D-transpeptidase [Candidatus Solibacter usitatus]|nr:L,D-transpeptidase [Candidatus Solibacter usitatus]